MKPPGTNTADGAVSSGATGQIGSALAGRRILVLDPTQSIPRLLRGVQGVVLSVGHFRELDRAQLALTRPDVILAPLVVNSYDIVDLVRSLRDMGYGGAVRAYCHPLPSLRMVRAEVAQVWPECDFEIYEVPAPEAPDSTPPAD